jgi:tetratricopeptide (TPR) repeat protein
MVERFMRGASSFDRNARFKQLLRLLYVAVTRARRHLAIFDGAKPHPFWTNSQLHFRLDTEHADILSRLFRESATAAEWEKEAQYYVDRLRYRQAAECYRRAGMMEEETAAQAMYAETIGQWQAALSLWQQLNKLDRQAPLLEKLGRPEEALNIYKSIGKAADVERLEVGSAGKTGPLGRSGKTLGGCWKFG